MLDIEIAGISDHCGTDNYQLFDVRFLDLYLASDQ